MTKSSLHWPKKLMNLFHFLAKNRVSLKKNVYFEAPLASPTELKRKTG